MQPPTTNTEELIQQTGGCGLFQIIHVTVLYLGRIAAIWAMNMMAFGNYNPGWTSLELAPNLAPLNNKFELAPNLVSLASNKSSLFQANHSTSSSEKNHSTLSQVNDSIPLEINLSNKSSTLQENNGSQNLTHLQLLPTIFTNSSCSQLQLPTFSRFVFNPSADTIVTQWNLVCDRSWITSFITSLQMLGQLTGVVLGGYFAENMGRKKTYFGVVFMFFFTNLAASFSNCWQVFTVMRFLIGVSIGGVNLAAYPYTVEFLTCKWRGIVGGLPGTNLGLLAFSLLVYVERDWKLVQISTAGLSLVALLTGLWASESVRWLAVHGKMDQAKRVVCRIASYNKTKVPSMDVIDLVSATQNRESSHDNDGDNSSRVYSYKDLFNDRKSCILTVRISFLFFSCYISYMALSFSIGALPGDFYTNLIIFSASEIPAVTVCGPIVNKFGRVRGGACYFGVSGIMCVLAVLVLVSGLGSTYPMAMVLLLMTMKGLLAAVRAILKIIAVEVTPTSIRALAMSFYLTISMAGGIIGPFLVPGTIFSLGWVITILSIFLTLSMAIMLTLPETKDKLMPDFEEKFIAEKKSSHLDLENGGSGLPTKRDNHEDMNHNATLVFNGPKADEDEELSSIIGAGEQRQNGGGVQNSVENDDERKSILALSALHKSYME